MNILIIQPWITRGGSEIIALQSAYSLKKRGHNTVIVAVSCDYTNLPRYAKSLTILTVPFGKYIQQHPFLFMLFSFPLLLLLTLLHARKADIIHPHVPPSLWVAAIPSLLFRKPIVWWCNDIYNKEYAKNNKKNLYDYLLPLLVGSWLDKKIVGLVKEIIVYSPQTKEAVKRLYNRTATVIPCGPDEDFFSQTPNQKRKNTLLRKNFVLLSVGKLHPQKNNILALETLENVLPQIPHSMLLFAGTGPMQKDLEIYVKQHNLTKHVTFLGFVSENALIQLYASSNVVLFTAREQSWGLVPLEALLNGSMPLVTTSAAVSSILKKHDIGFVANATVGDFSNKLLYIFNHKLEVKEKIKKGQTYIRNTLSWDKTGILLEKVFTQAFKKTYLP